MKITYRKLFKLLEEKGLRKTYLRQHGLTPATVDRIIHDRSVTTYTIVKICELLKCQPGDIMEVIDDE